MFEYFNNELPDSFQGLFRLNQEIHHYNTSQLKHSHVKSKRSTYYTGPTKPTNQNQQITLDRIHVKCK